MVGPVPPGVNKFLFEADAPNTANIPNSDIVGITVILLTCSYDGREFVRVGYYVNTEYTDEALAQNPPAKPVIEKIRRNILADKPRVTRFAIRWFVSIPLNCYSLLILAQGLRRVRPARVPAGTARGRRRPGRRGHLRRRRGRGRRRRRRR
jgi:hypothetical protein